MFSSSSGNVLAGVFCLCGERLAEAEAQAFEALMAITELPAIMPDGVHAKTYQTSHSREKLVHCNRSPA